MMETPNVELVAREDGVRIVTFGRPEVLNVLNLDTLRDLRACLADVARDERARGVWLRGGLPEAGSKAPAAFAAGADVALMSRIPVASDEREGAFIGAGQALMNEIEALGVPVIALVDGYALGGGFELALACDIVLASTRAVFGFPEVTLGLMPGWGGTQRLPRRIGASAARRLIFTGDRLDATQALALGLVQEVVAPETLEAAAEALTKRMLKAAPGSLRAAKAAMVGGEDLPLAEGLACEMEQFHRCFATEDRVEGTTAFVQKRKPVYKGR